MTSPIYSQCGLGVHVTSKLLLRYVTLRLRYVTLRYVTVDPWAALERRLCPSTAPSSQRRKAPRSVDDFGAVPRVVVDSSSSPSSARLVGPSCDESDDDGAGWDAASVVYGFDGRRAHPKRREDAPGGEEA